MSDHSHKVDVALDVVALIEAALREDHAATPRRRSTSSPPSSPGLGLSPGPAWPTGCGARHSAQIVAGPGPRRLRTAAKIIGRGHTRAGFLGA
jgi:hypothetical protein